MLLICLHTNLQNIISWNSVSIWKLYDLLLDLFMSLLGYVKILIWELT